MEEMAAETAGARFVRLVGGAEFTDGACSAMSTSAPAAAGVTRSVICAPVGAISVPSRLKTGTGGASRRLRSVRAPPAPPHSDADVHARAASHSGLGHHLLQHATPRVSTKKQSVLSCEFVAIHLRLAGPAASPSEAIDAASASAEIQNSEVVDSCFTWPPCPRPRPG